MSWSNRLATTAIAGLVASFALVPQSAAQDEPVVLDAVLPLLADHGLMWPLFELERMVEANPVLKDKIEINYMGGPEVFQASEQLDALQRGVFDLTVGIGAYYEGNIPAASATLAVRKLPSELRETGYYDLMREVHAEHGVVYLAHVGGAPGGYRLYLNEKIDEVADLSGKSLRVSGTYVPMMEALNVTPVFTRSEEVHAAMERGMVEGFGWAYMGIVDYGLDEVIKYVLDHPFYSFDTAILFSEKTWNELSEEVRAELEKVAVELEKRTEDYMVRLFEEEDRRLRESGVEFFQLPEDEAEKFLKAAYEARWERTFETAPEVAERLRELSGD